MKKNTVILSLKDYLDLNSKIDDLEEINSELELRIDLILKDKTTVVKYGLLFENVCGINYQVTRDSMFYSKSDALDEMIKNLKSVDKLNNELHKEIEKVRLIKYKWWYKLFTFLD